MDGEGNERSGRRGGTVARGIREWRMGRRDGEKIQPSENIGNSFLKNCEDPSRRDLWEGGGKYCALKIIAELFLSRFPFSNSDFNENSGINTKPPGTLGNYFAVKITKSAKGNNRERGGQVMFYTPEYNEPY